MTKRWMILSGVLLAAVAAVAAGLTAFGGGTHPVAGRTTVSPAPVATPSLPPTPTPTSRRTAKRHHTVTTRASAASRRRATHVTTHDSGASQADPCAHNHHCSVPPLPPLKPNPDRPAPLPTLTITGAPAT
ncbi:hypothetical protein [Actinoallomurus iriomotensis]|uniref:hypothetical protein n=1 Tax=Actinoallomurus iriomotensis TaxID=478107 RepID=UPI002554825B|nr:hypothetical protein [Actinoallomurus iriomotensis]